MDPLSVTASVISILQLSSEAVKYINSASGATKQRKGLREELRACEGVLQQIKDESDDSEEGKAWSKTIIALESPGAPLGRLRMTLNIIVAKLQPKDGITKALESLKWPFNEREVKNILASIEREKSLLDLALSNNSRKLVQEIKKTSEDNGRRLLDLKNELERSSKETESQFRGLKDNLQLVHNAQDDLLDGLNQIHHHHNNQKFHTFLNWLAPQDYYSQQNDFIRRRQPGTGQWLLDSTEFRKWVETPRTTLFCPGIPGAGKTILTSIVINDLTSCYGNDPYIGIAYIFCNFRQQDDKKVEDLIASLLKQLTRDMPSLPQDVQLFSEKYRKMDARPLLDEISEALQSVWSMYRRVFIIVDALDECKSSDGCRSRFLTELLRVQGSLDANLFITSRSIPEITARFEGDISLEVRATDEDVRRYIDGHIPRLPGFVTRSGELQEDIKAGIIQSVQGMFLLAQLHLDSLIGKRSPKAIRTALVKLPTGSGAYDHAYQSAMERIEGQGPDQEILAKQVLSWITYARRALTTTELQHALAVEVWEPRMDEENLPQIEDMVSVCAGLVTVDKESDIIRLVHHTTQEYFERTQEKWFLNMESEITEVCITYLSYDIFESGICVTRNEFLKRLKTNPLYDYAATYWGRRAKSASTTSKGLIEFLQKIPQVEASAQCSTGFRLYTKEEAYDQRFTGLHLAAHFGILEAVRSLIQISRTPDMPDCLGRSPLLYATSSASRPVVKLLLDTGEVDVNRRDSMGQTPLLIAARNGYEDIMKLFLDTNKANLDSDYLDGWTPLFEAVGNRSVAIVKMLLENKADVNIVDNSGRTPSSGVVLGRTKLTLRVHNTVYLAFERGMGWNPLLLAINIGHEEIVKLLLEHDDINAKDKPPKISWVQLACALVDKHQTMASLLIERNYIDLDSIGPFGRTPLAWAACYGYKTIVGLLLKYGSNKLNQTDDRGQAPLSLASMEGHMGIVRLLLGCDGIDVNSRDVHDWTPLMWAALEGREKIVRLLLEDPRVDLNARSVSGLTALSHARAIGNGPIVELLLKASALDKPLEKSEQGN